MTRIPGHETGGCVDQKLGPASGSPNVTSFLFVLFVVKGREEYTLVRTIENQRCVKALFILDLFGWINPFARRILYFLLFFF